MNAPSRMDENTGYTTNAFNLSIITFEERFLRFERKNVLKTNQRLVYCSVFSYCYARLVSAFFSTKLINRHEEPAHFVCDT